MGKISDRLRQRYAERSGDAPASKGDVSRLRNEMDRNMRKMDPGRQSGAQIAGKTARMFGRGFANIGKSLSSPSDDRRPKISQMPGRRSEIGISQGMGLDYLKMPGMRGQGISFAGGGGSGGQRAKPKAKKRRR